MILVNGQWQGGGNRETLDAALAAAKRIPAPFTNAPVSHESDLTVKNGITGYDVIWEQTVNTLSKLSRMAPDVLFTIGGGCDADVASIVWLNEKYDGRMTVIWMDAHGDLNAPAESTSHLFYGMPLRALLGDCPPMNDLIAKPLRPDQVIHIGGRDFEDVEKRYIRETPLSAFPVSGGKISDQRKVFERIGSESGTPVYLHFDMDVLDPGDFSDTPLPIRDGLAAQEAIDFIKLIRARYTLVGMGIFEFLREGVEHSVFRSLLEIGKAISEDGIPHGGMEPGSDEH